MREILFKLYNISYYSELLASETDLPIEDVEYYCTSLLIEITEAETVMRDGFLYVSSELPMPDGIRGLGRVGKAIYGGLGNGYQAEAFAVDGISARERLFLQELSASVEELWKPYDNYLKGITDSPGPIRDFTKILRI